MTQSQDGDIIRQHQIAASRERMSLDDTHPARERTDLDGRSAEARAAAARGELSFAQEQQDAILAANRAVARRGEHRGASAGMVAAEAALRGQGGGLARKGRSLLDD